MQDSSESDSGELSSSSSIRCIASELKWVINQAPPQEPQNIRIVCTGCWLGSRIENDTSLLHEPWVHRVELADATIKGADVFVFLEKQCPIPTWCPFLLITQNGKLGCVKRPHTFEPGTVSLEFYCYIHLNVVNDSAGIRILPEWHQIQVHMWVLRLGIWLGIFWWCERVNFFLGHVPDLLRPLAFIGCI